MTSNPHFEEAASWVDAATKVDFDPREPRDTAGHDLQSLRVHVMDHRMRRLEVGERSLEAHYGAFVVSQSRHDPEEARRIALELSYGSVSREVRVSGHEARTYELGPEPPPGDVDGRPPAVVTWSDGEMFYLIASDQLPVAVLERVAGSI